MEIERKLPLSGFVLKVIAMVLMTIDHIGVFMQMERMGDPVFVTVLRIIGRLALPIFLFLFIEGVRHTHSPYRYLGRIGILYVLLSTFSAIAIYGFKEAIPGNIFTDLFYILAFFVFLRDKGWRKLLCLIPLTFILGGYICDVVEKFTDTTILWYPYILRPSYGLVSFLMALGFYLAPKFIALLTKQKDGGESFTAFLETSQGRKAVNIASGAFLFVIVLLLWGISYATPGRELGGFLDMSFETYSLLAIPFLYFYSGKRGYDSKAWRIFSYAYFPAHLVVLFLIFALI